jgi:large subunit ribosomal protein L30
MAPKAQTKPKTQTRKTLLAVRVRGTVSAQREATETLRMLHLGHTNYAVLIDNRPAYRGMLKRVQAYATWGEPSKKLTEEQAQKLGFKSIEDLADALMSGKAEYSKLSGMRPLFRLRPPTKGYKGKTKKSFNAGGEAGYRGEKIDELVKRMV